MKKEDIYFSLPNKGTKKSSSFARFNDSALFSCFQSVGSVQPLIDAYN